jgi:hypothetical protein
MATATVKYSLTTRPMPFGSQDQQTVTYFGSVAFSAAGDTYATGGLAALAGFDLKNLGPYADRTPLSVFIFSQAGSGWEYEFNVATKKLMIIAGGGSTTAAAVELANATALNAAVPNIFTDVVAFEFVFPRGA